MAKSSHRGKYKSKVDRDSESGQFRPEGYAKRHPSTATTEVNWIPRKKRKK